MIGEAKRWIPLRRGGLYCSPACGGGCTHAAFLRAEKAALEICLHLEQAGVSGGWKPRVWENLGWHWAVIDRNKRLKVCASDASRSSSSDYWVAFLGEPADVCSGQWVGTGNTPEAAVKHARAQAQTELDQIQAALNETASGEV